MKFKIDLCILMTQCMFHTEFRVFIFSLPEQSSDCMFWLKFFYRSYLLNPYRDSFDTCTVARYWSRVLPSIILTLLSDLAVKVIDLKNCFFSDWMF